MAAEILASVSPSSELVASSKTNRCGFVNIARAGEAGVVTLATSKQQSAVRGLTSRAGVYPKFVDVRPHHAELVSITGSKEPSGIAHIAPVADKPKFGGRKPRPEQDQRRRRPR